MKKVLLSNVVEIAHGKGLPQRYRIAEQLPIFGSNGQVDTHNQSLIGRPGIIVGRKKSVGKIIWLRQDFRPIDTTYYIKLKNLDDNLKYWYYVFKGLRLNVLNSRSAISSLNCDVVHAKQVSLRSALEQKKTADILGGLDGKIELNRRMNEALEQFGQALFRHYFVDNPEAKSWDDVKVGELINIRGSGTPSTKNSSFWVGILCGLVHETWLIKNVIF